MSLLGELKDRIKETGQIVDDLVGQGAKGLLEAGRKLGIIPPEPIAVPVNKPPKEKGRSGGTRTHYQPLNLSEFSMPNWEQF